MPVSVSAVLSLLLCGAAFVSSSVHAAEVAQPAIRLGNHRQLFVDDYLIDRMEGVTRVLNPAKKYPANPVLRADRPWEGMTLFVRSVLYDENEKTFSMWYVGFAPGDRPGCCATSKDGIHWEKPDLGLIASGGSAATNLIPWGSARGIIYSPQDRNPARRYKSLDGLIGAFSPDGFSWNTPAESQAIPGDIASDNVVTCFYDSINDRYVAIAKVVRSSGEHLRRSVSISFSDDFLKWTPVRSVLVPDARDDELARHRVVALRDHLQYDDGPQWHIAQFYSMAGFVYEGMYLGMLNVFDISGWPPGLEKRPSAGGEDGPGYIELTSSRDLHNWNRVGNREILIPVGSKRSWESGWIGTATLPVIVGDEIRIYYSGLMVSHGDNKFLGAEGDRIPMARAEAKAMGGIGAVGFATLRLDGWASIDGGDREGTLTTKPMIFETGNKLVINASATRGSVAVEIVDEDGDPLPGFRKADCVAFDDDAIRHTVLWGGEPDLSQLVGRALRLRFHLKNAKLYSFVFQN
jgi:hypothetical protein